jgi:dynein light intermediate chain 1
MEYLEKTQSWKEEEFDVVLQFMRTVLLKRMAPFPAGPLSC